MIKTKTHFSLLVAGALVLPAALLSQEAPRPPRPPRPGVKKPGVQRPITAITPDAVFPVEGTPDWQVVTKDAVWVANGPKNTIHKLDAKTNKVAAAIEVAKRPCSGLAAGFGSIWVPSCGDKVLVRVDMETNEILSTIPVGPAASEGGLIATADSIWMLSDPKGILSRIDPDTNRVIAEVPVPPGSFACVVGEDGAIWVSSTENNLLVRIDPKTNLVTDRIEVGPQPRFLTAGADSIWTLNQGDGTVSRVDIKTKKRGRDIELGGPGGGGEIAFGEGYVWVTLFELPLTQIDPKTDQVIKQWVGLGGDAVRVGHGSVWLSNLRQQNLWRINPKQP
jgi:YVTN family beta-propeller protein